MALPESLRSQLALPVFCAPMFRVSGPDLVREACKAGFVGGLPRPNAGDLSQFDSWLRQIRSDLDVFAASHPDRPVGPIAVNLSTRLQPADLESNLDICERYGVQIIVSAAGDPTQLIPRVHDRGLLAFHDVTSLRFAEKAIAADADGLICIGSGGGGHSGLVNHMVLVPQVRRMFSGVIVMAGAIATGAAVRAAEVLGADLAYMGTRFIATRESLAPDDYKQMLVDSTSADLLYTPRVTGVPANWLQPSLRNAGLDPEDLPSPAGKGMGHGHLPAHIQPWSTVWSAGQAVELIDDVPSVAQLARRLECEYFAACEAGTLFREVPCTS